MHDALAPIVGQRGVAALFARTLHVTRKDHPWLAPTPPNAAGSIDLTSLRAVLCERQAHDVALAGDAFLHNFSALLSSLVGKSLAEHLIGPARTQIHGGDAAQDP